MQAANSQGSQAGAIDRPHPAAILSHQAAHLKPCAPQGTVNGTLALSGLVDPCCELVL